MNKSSKKSNAVKDSIGGRIKSTRIIRGLSSTQLHDKTGIAQSSLTRYEKGNRIPGAIELRKLCVALDISPNYLLWGDDSKAFGSLTVNVYDMEIESDNQFMAIVAILFTKLARPDRTAMLQLLMTIVYAQIGEDSFAKLREDLLKIGTVTSQIMEEHSDEIVKRYEAALEPTSTDVE